MNYTAEQLAIVAEHYLNAACWADCEEGTNPRAPAQTVQHARQICAAFIDRWPVLFKAAIERGHRAGSSPEAAFGHDLWLTTRGHGAGFWDRTELDDGGLGDALTEACETFGEPSFAFYRGWLYLHPEYSINRDKRFMGAAA